MKRSLIFAAAVFCASCLAAEEKSVEVTYTVSGEVITNFTAQVVEGSNFFTELPLPEGVLPNRVTLEGTCEQEGHTNCCLTVGLNKYDTSYTRSKPLKGAVNDAKMMAAALKKGGVYNKFQTLLDEQGMKDNIREIIHECAEKLVEGDSFLYYHSSHGSDDPVYSVCTYNADYTAEDLAYDISLFRDGVKVVIIIDACHSGGMFEEDGYAQGFADAFQSKLSEIKVQNAPPGADLKVSDCVFLCAARKDQSSQDIGENSAFTKGLLSFCAACAADTDKDGLVSFREVYERACDFTKDIIKKGQDPVISNPMLAESWCFGHVADHDGVYALSVHPDDGSTAFSLNKVTQDLKVNIMADDKKNTFDLKAFKAKIDLTKEAKVRASYMTIVNATLVFPFAIEKPEEIVELPSSLVLLDTVFISGGVSLKASKNKVKLGDLIKGQNVVDSVLSVNQKKNQTTLKIKYSYYTDLYNRLEPGTYAIPFSSRIRGDIYRKDINVTVTEKSGKSLMIKLNKKAPK
jgi:hypothetical protein